MLAINKLKSAQAPIIKTKAWKGTNLEWYMHEFDQKNKQKQADSDSGIRTEPKLRARVMSPGMFEPTPVRRS